MGSIEEVQMRLRAGLGAATDAVVNAVASTENIPEQYPEFTNLITMWRGVRVLVESFQVALDQLLTLPEETESEAL